MCCANFPRDDSTNLLGDPGAGPCAGGCDDKNPCTVDTCEHHYCVHKRPVPLTCGNGKLDACETCDVLTSSGHDSPICKACSEVGRRYHMYLIPGQRADTAYYSVVADAKAYKLVVECNQPGWVVSDYGGVCEGGGKPYLSAGALKTKSVTITCAGIGGANYSTYEFLCARK